MNIKVNISESVFDLHFAKQFNRIWNLYYESIVSPHCLRNSLWKDPIRYHCTDESILPICKCNVATKQQKLLEMFADFWRFQRWFWHWTAIVSEVSRWMRQLISISKLQKLGRIKNSFSHCSSPIRNICMHSFQDFVYVAILCSTWLLRYLVTKANLTTITNSQIVWSCD